jgi:hypothetical protein
MTLADLALDVGDRAIGRLRQATLFASKRELIKPIDKHRVLDDLSTMIKNAHITSSYFWLYL